MFSRFQLTCAVIFLMLATNGLYMSCKSRTPTKLAQLDSLPAYDSICEE